MIIQIGTNNQYFSLALFVMLYKVVIIFESVDEISTKKSLK